MRNIELSLNFKRDLRRLSGGMYRSAVVRPDGELWQVVDILAEDGQLPQKYRDHQLKGKRRGYRECHVNPDLLLVYAHIGLNRLLLDRLGSHAEIFGL